MKTALIVGGSNGIGMAIAYCLTKDYHVIIIDKNKPDALLDEKCNYEPFDLATDDYSIFDKYNNVDLVMITAGFGHLALFQDIDEPIIKHYFQVNTISVIRIIKHFYNRLIASSDFYLGVMVSIAGFMSSPFFSIYGATKAALKVFIESVNVELEKAGTTNRILNVSPGSIEGTRFNGNKKNNITKIMPLAKEIIVHLHAKDDLLIPQYEEVFHTVLERYHKDFRAEGLHSYDYKMKSGRVKSYK